MDIKSIQTLVAVADHRSFQAAADVLGMSISNVSLQIAALEKSLDLPLFDRNFRPPRMTDKGRDFVFESRKLLIQWKMMTQSSSNHAPGGFLKVGAVHTSVSGGVSVALGNLRKKNPNVFLRLHTDLTTQLIQQLKSQSIDCAIITQPTNPEPGYSFTHIADEELGVIASRQAEGVSYRDVLENNPYLRFNKQATLSLLIEDELKSRGITIDAAMEVTTLDAVESLVKNDLGVSVVPIGKTVSYFSDGIRILPFQSPRFKRTLGILFSEDCPRVHLIELLTQELISAYQ